MQVWAEEYSDRSGPEVTIDLDGTDLGASRICDNSSEYDPVEVAIMSRDFYKYEAKRMQDRYTYQCMMGDTTREVIQIDVVEQTLAVIVNETGIAADCIDITGGLTTDQLRWIYSSLKPKQLKETGWKAHSIPGTDRDRNTHLWSELSSDSTDACADVEIKIAGLKSPTTAHNYFKDTIFLDDDEVVDEKRPDIYFEGKQKKILNYVSNNGEAIAFVKYPDLEIEKDNLRIVKISTCNNKKCPTEQFLEPTTKKYPLSRMVQMNVLSSAARLVLQFIEFGMMSLMYEAIGEQKMKVMGLTGLPKWKRMLMMERLKKAIDL